VVFTTAALPGTKEWLPAQVNECTKQMHDAIDHADSTRPPPITASRDDWKMPTKAKKNEWHRVGTVHVSAARAKHIVQQEFGLPWHSTKPSGNVVHAFDWMIPSDWGQERVEALLAALSEFSVLRPSTPENSDTIQDMLTRFDGFVDGGEDLSG